MLERHLAPGGYLFISHSESLNGISHGLQWVAPAVYRRGAVSDLRAQPSAWRRRGGRAAWSSGSASSAVSDTRRRRHRDARPGQLHRGVHLGPDRRVSPACCTSCCRIRRSTPSVRSDRSPATFADTGFPLLFADGVRAWDWQEAPCRVRLVGGADVARSGRRRASTWASGTFSSRRAACSGGTAC